MPKPLGLTLERAKHDLEELLERRSSITHRLNELDVDPESPTPPKEYLQLQGELRVVEAEIGQTQEWYIMDVLKDLSSTSSRVERLTRAFMILTVLFILVTIPLIRDEIWGLLIGIWRLMGIDFPS